MSRIAIAMTLFLCVCLGGCAGGNQIGKEQELSVKDWMTLDQPRSDLLDVVAEVGKSMGYSVFAIDREKSTISLSSDGKTVAPTGKPANVIMQLASKENGKRLDMVIHLSGAGREDKEEAARIADAFKSKLEERLNQPAMVTTPQPSSGGSPAPKISEAPKQQVVPPAEEPEYLTVLKGANIRHEASTRSKIIKKVRKGDRLEKIGETDKWYNVRLPSGQTGWIFKTLVEEK